MSDAAVAEPTTQAAPASGNADTVLASPPAGSEGSDSDAATDAAGADQGQNTLLGTDGNAEGPQADGEGGDGASEEKDSTDDNSADGNDDVPQYEDFTAYKGVEIDPAALEVAVPVFQQLGLDQEQAQQLVNLQSEITAAQMASYDAEVAAAVQDFRKEPDSAETLAFAQRALDQAGLTPEERAYFNGPGMGNNIALVKLLGKFGKLLREDTPLDGNTPAEPKSVERLLYDHPKSTFGKQ